MLRFGLVAVLTGLLLVPVSAGHPGAPARTKAQVERWLRNTPVKLPNGRVLRSKRTVYCSGVGQARKRVRFRHFNCLIVARKGRGTCCLPVHALAGGRWKYGRPLDYPKRRR